LNGDQRAVATSAANAMTNTTPPDDAPAGIDFSECEREPIRSPGMIQSHGFLLALELSGEVTHASENIGQYFPLSPRDILGSTLAQVLGPYGYGHLSEVLGKLQPGQMHHEYREDGQERYSLWAHHRGSRYIVEWEQVPATEAESSRLVGELLADGLSGIRGASHIHRQTQLAAELTARITGYDRTMVYQFQPDWTGQVIAEVSHPRAEPFLGLRYPATDIPSQARALYLENLLRSLVDVYAAPVGILSRPGDSVPLDLTMSKLRAFSPYHLEYLKNMKVGATGVASIICNGALWGLVACHHDRRKLLAPSELSALLEIVQTLGVSIQNTSARTRRLSAQRLAAREGILEAAIPDISKAMNAILFGPERLRNLVSGCGVTVWSASGIIRMGEAPEAEEMKTCAARLLEASEDPGQEEVIAIDSRAGLIEKLGFAPRNSSLAGLIAIVVSRDPALILFGFRLEAIREVIWGGDINEPVLRDERTGALSPRASFAQYKQSIAGKAVPWSEEDLANARIVRDVLRGKAPEPEQMGALIAGGMAEIRNLIAGDRAVQDALLDAITDGISILFRSDTGITTVRYANQTLLDLAEISTEPDSRLPSVQSLLEAVGLPEDIMVQKDREPSQVSIATANNRDLRHFLVERKLGLEISDHNGTLSLSALVFTDTTRSERAREALQAAQERAEHLASLKSSFLANMSHELRTPMNGILGMVQLLQETRKDPEQQEYLDVIQSSGDAMLHIINDILDLSKIEAGRMSLERAPFDLTALVQGVVDLLRAQAHAKSIGLSAVFDSPPPRWYEGDSYRLRQIILNLTGNAIKFTAAGHVTIHVLDADSTHTDAPLAVTVEDTGIGIAPQQLLEIFQKFSQADQSTTRKFGGTGLGLAISRELAELMGGAISVTSEAGKGSTFKVALPLKRSDDRNRAAAVPLTAKPHPLAAGAGHRILVAEDDAASQTVIKAMLKKKGFEVEVARNGRKLLELLAAGPCDLILMDCHMPELDGFETTARIRSMESGGTRTPIVALTADTQEEGRQHCLDAGMDDYMTKPIGMKDLWAMLRKWKCLPPEEPLRVAS
jgi:light-regulated signal transduction histidine kinase (bacteriophytochrome)/CheY-like chemotaxis protein